MIDVLLAGEIPLTDPAVAAAVAKADWIGFMMFLVQTIGTTVVTVLLPWIAYKQAALGNKFVKLDDSMEKLEKNTNSIKDELVKVTGEKAHAAGVLEEKTRHEK